jgi:hypothetical protein
MLKVTGLPDGITQSDLNQIFSKYQILTSSKKIEENGSISYLIELKENKLRAREELDTTEQIIKGEWYTIRVDQFRGGDGKQCGQPGEPPCPVPVPEK